MDGVLLIDKPVGPTSHDVVARIRRTIRQRSVGHTGTLDPLASGLLPLVLGRATRLASLLSSRRKTYVALVRLGFETDTDDAAGRPIGAPAGSLPTDQAIDAALERFRGTFDQAPPGYSAKRIGGERAYALARRGETPPLPPVAVTVDRLDRLDRTGDLVELRLETSAGFYVRALARDLGRALGCGAHLAALRRTASGEFDVTEALPLGEAERLGEGVAAHVRPLASLLPDLAAVRVTPAGLRRVVHGNDIGPGHLDSERFPEGVEGGRVKVLGPDGALIALAESRPGSLHPVVVLG